MNNNRLLQESVPGSAAPFANGHAGFTFAEGAVLV